MYKMINCAGNSVLLKPASSPKGIKHSFRSWRNGQVNTPAKIPPSNTGLDPSAICWVTAQLHIHFYCFLTLIATNYIYVLYLICNCNWMKYIEINWSLFINVCLFILNCIILAPISTWRPNYICYHLHGLILPSALVLCIIRRRI